MKTPRRCWISVFEKPALHLFLWLSFIAAAGKQFTEICFKRPIIHIQACRAKQYSAAIQRTIANNYTCYKEAVTSMRSHGVFSQCRRHWPLPWFLTFKRILFPSLAAERTGSLGFCGWVLVVLSGIFTIILFPITIWFSLRVSDCRDVADRSRPCLGCGCVFFFSQTSRPLINLPPPSADCAGVWANCHFQTGSHHRQEGQGTRYVAAGLRWPPCCISAVLVLLFFCWRHFLERVSKLADMLWSSWRCQRELWYLTPPTRPGAGSSLWGLHMAAWFSIPLSQHVEAQTEHHF